MNHDPIDTLAQLRPVDSDLDAHWAPAHRASALDAILTTRRRSRRRWYVSAGVAAAAAAGLAVALVRPDQAPAPARTSPPAPIAVPGVPAGTRTPQSSASALPPVHLVAAVSMLHHLAHLAAALPADLGDGRYWHLRIREQQHGPESQPDRDETLESWTDQDGRVWRHDVITFAGLPPQDEYYEFPAGSDQVNYPSPAYLASLPTDPDALYAFLDSHVLGSSSHEEAIFVAVGDMLRGGFAPPALRSAAIDVLTRLPHVFLSSSTTDPLGRTVHEFVFVDESIRPGESQSISFDPQTAEILDEAVDSHGGQPLDVAGPSGTRQELSSDSTYTSSVLVADTVDQIPQEVRDNAVLQHG
jgi:hypothetical protein